MEQPTTNQTDPKPAPPVDTLDQAIQSGDLQAFNRIERERKQGKAPEKVGEAVNEPEAAAGTSGDTPAGSTDPHRKAVPETAEPERKPGKKDAKARAAEVDADVAALEEKLRRRAELRRLNDAEEAAERRSQEAGKKPEAAAGTKDAAVAEVPGWKKYREMAGAPKVDDFQSLEDYVAAAVTFVGEKLAEERFGSMFDERMGKERAASERDLEFAAAVDRATVLAQAEIEAEPGILDEIDDRWKALNPPDRLAEGERLTPAHWIKNRVVFHSNHPYKLSRLLTRDDSAELKRIYRMSPDAIIRELAYMDASFGLPNGDGATAADGSQPNRVSKAPAPPPTLGKKASAGRDEMAQAIASGDLQAFNRATLAEKRGRK